MAESLIGSKGIYEKYIKRVLDIVCSLAIIILFWWLYLIVALLVKIKLGSPVIFKQERPGKDEKTFYLYKFRSMTDKKDENGNLLPDNVRLTPFGKKLRSTSLDELPEIFNILKGNMSFVGPRPLAKRYLPYYSVEERKRHSVLPGLTGLAQINGRNNLSWEERFSYDIEYVNGITFLKDIKILAGTVAKVLKSQDITVREEGNIKDFDVERREKGSGL